MAAETGRTDVDPTRCGPIERQARGDIANMGPLVGGARATFAEMAFNLASALDRAYGNEAPLAEVVTGSKVLLTIMNEVVKTAHVSSRAEELQEYLSRIGAEAPVGNTPDMGAGNLGRESWHDRPDAGKATDAAPAVRDGRGTGD